METTTTTTNTINPLASPSAGAPALKYRDVNTETTSPGEVKGLIVLVVVVVVSIWPFPAENK